VSGQLGSVVANDEVVESRPEILDHGYGFRPVDVEFSRRGNTYYPLDYASLLAASLYYSIERGYLMFASLDGAGDLKTRVPDLSGTLIVLDARRQNDSGNLTREVYDNAEYLPHRVKTSDGTEFLRNYIFAFPNQDISALPLGLNIGILIHEYTHMVFQYLFYEPGISRNVYVTESNEKPTSNTLAAIDEGLADYFSFVSTRDPSFFECSFPNSGRDLSQSRYLTHEIRDSLLSEDRFDPHELGAVIASINWEIGEVLGNHEANARSLLKMMASLLDCPEVVTSRNVLSMNVQSLSACQARAATDSRLAEIIRRTYSKYLSGGDP